MYIFRHFILLVCMIYCVLLSNAQTRKFLAGFDQVNSNDLKEAITQGRSLTELDFDSEFDPAQYDCDLLSNAILFYINATRKLKKRTPLERKLDMDTWCFVFTHNVRESSFRARYRGMSKAKKFLKKTHGEFNEERGFYEFLIHHDYAMIYDKTSSYFFDEEADTQMKLFYGHLKDKKGDDYKPKEIKFRDITFFI